MPSFLDSLGGKAERARNPAVLLKVVSEEFRLYDKYQRKCSKKMG
jgi:hypothetical protein